MSKTAGYDWIIGLGLAIIIAIAFTFINFQFRQGEGSGLVFFAFLTLGMAISVYAGLLDLWYLVLSSIFLIFILIFTSRSRGD